MGEWKFSEANLSSVWQDPNQGDQFDNDDVGLCEALVREVIQNSVDAGLGNEPVKVCFNIKRMSGGDAHRLREKLKPLLPHLKACKIEADCLTNNNDFFVLTIEDFNTTGLTGKYEERDNGNFTNFWRNLARSDKKGQKGGRWGLGKLVFSNASQIRAFYGRTIRHDDKKDLLMGQVVLKHHKVNNTDYEPHGFWAQPWEGNELALPTISQEEIKDISSLTGINRDSEPGLSIIIPFLRDGIDDEKIIKGIVENYYFPILSGHLELNVSGIIINEKEFTEIANRYSTNSIIPFAFVREVSDQINSETEFITEHLTDKQDLENSFSEETIEKMKRVYACGNLLKVRCQIELHPKNETVISSYFDLFLQKLPEGATPFSLFSRGVIILKDEKRYFNNPAYGALIASEKNMAMFLGDAENPAHTRWNSRADKLKQSWDNTEKTLSTIRHTLKKLYELIADQEVEEDTNVLSEFFSIKKPKTTKPGQKPKSQTPSLDIPKREQGMIIIPRQGGFDIRPNKGAKKWKYPKTIRIRIAYDTFNGNPFKKSSPFDFDLGKSKNIKISKKNGKVTKEAHNIILFKIDAGDFALRAQGFDKNRDLVVDAKVLEN